MTPSFPPRRSSDLGDAARCRALVQGSGDLLQARRHGAPAVQRHLQGGAEPVDRQHGFQIAADNSQAAVAAMAQRSEFHRVFYSLDLARIYSSAWRKPCGFQLAT